MSVALAALAAKGEDVTAADMAAVPPIAAGGDDGALRPLPDLDRRAASARRIPVARFHLANGARLERLNWMGDSSTTGLRRSYGLTVNYVYRLADLERNHDSYANHFRVASSREFQQLARPRR